MIFISLLSLLISSAHAMKAPAEKFVRSVDPKTGLPVLVTTQENFRIQNLRLGEPLRAPSTAREIEYASRPLEMIGPEAEGWVSSALQNIAARWKAKSSDGSLTAGQRQFLREMLVETTDAVKAQLELRMIDPSGSSASHPRKLVEGALTLITKLEDQWKDSPTSVTDFARDAVVTYSGIPFHSNSKRHGSAESGLAALARISARLQGDQLVGLAKWLESYAAAVRTARAESVPLDEAHRNAAKARDALLLSGRKQASSLRQILCECTRSC